MCLFEVVYVCGGREIDGKEGIVLCLFLGCSASQQHARDGFAQTSLRASTL